MKRNSFKKITMFLLVLLIGILAAGCASAPAQATSNEPEYTPAPDQSLIVIQRKKTMVGAAVSMKVWIDDGEAASVKNGQETRLIIADGEHVVQAGSNSVDKGEAVTFSVFGEKITFFAEPQMGLLAARFKLTQTGKDKF